MTGNEKSNIAEPPTTGGAGLVDALKSLHDMGFDMNQLNGRKSDTSAKRSDITKSESNKNEDSIDASTATKSDISTSNSNKKEEYGWSKIKSGCSMSCGGGIETVTSECRRLDDGSPVRDDHCDRRSKPPMQQYPCKEEACPPV